MNRKSSRAISDSLSGGSAAVPHLRPSAVKKIDFEILWQTNKNN